MSKRFTIRDLFAIVTIASCLIAWWIDHERLTAQNDLSHALVYQKDQHMMLMADTLRESGYSVDFKDNTVFIYPAADKK